MQVTSLRIKNFKSFVDSSDLSLSKINVFVGANNAGKSAILRALHQLQMGSGVTMKDVRLRTQESHTEINIVNVDSPAWPQIQHLGLVTAQIRMITQDRSAGNTAFDLHANSTSYSASQLPSKEPNHFIVPYLSKRKAYNYQEDIRDDYVKSITTDPSYLSAKLSRVSNQYHPSFKKYDEACRAILGLGVTNISSPNGQLPGVYTPTGETLEITQLGEGVASVVHFLANLCISEGKLFLIEEPENDLHPEALKALLDLIVQSSSSNQFVISTHSNIVVKHLCATPDSLLYEVRLKQDTELPESEVIRVPDSPSDRMALLAKMGYALSDFELWDGWLILEESSAERIIRDFLIPLFTPTLTRVRTISSAGVGNTRKMFDELNRLFLFTHLSPIYRDASWVLVDGDEAGLNAVAELETKYPTHGREKFRNLSKTDFECYYPEEFQSEVEQILAIANSESKRKAKAELLGKVLNWLHDDRERAKLSLQKSAREVIQILVEIEKNLGKRLTSKEVA